MGTQIVFSCHALKSQLCRELQARGNGCPDPSLRRVFFFGKRPVDLSLLLQNRSGQGLLLLISSLQSTAWIASRHLVGGMMAQPQWPPWVPEVVAPNMGIQPEAL